MSVPLQSCTLAWLLPGQSDSHLVPVSMTQMVATIPVISLGTTGFNRLPCKTSSNFPFQFSELLASLHRRIIIPGPTRNCRNSTLSSHKGSCHVSRLQQLPDRSLTAVVGVVCCGILIGLFTPLLQYRAAGKIPVAAPTVTIRPAAAADY